MSNFSYCERFENEGSNDCFTCPYQFCEVWKDKEFKNKKEENKPKKNLLNKKKLRGKNYGTKN